MFMAISLVNPKEFLAQFEHTESDQTLVLNFSGIRAWIQKKNCEIEGVISAGCVSGNV